MSVRALCSDCGRTVRGGDDWAGKSGKCPSCGGTIAFPSSPSNFVPPRQRPPLTVAPTPIVFDSPSPRATATPKLRIEHKAAGGAFGLGFGLMLGCLAAGALFLVGGCLVIGFVASTAVDA